MLPSQHSDINCPVSRKVLFLGSGEGGKFGPTMKISLIFLECVRDKGTTDQLVIGGKIAGITDSISPDNPSIQVLLLLLLFLFWSGHRISAGYERPW